MARSKSKKSRQKPTEPAPRPSLWQRSYAAYWLPTVAATVVLFLALELVLALVGVLPANVYEDPFVGFSSTQPLFEPGGPNGEIMATAENKLRFFNYQEFPREKGPNTYRIFCLGGSTTFGRPYDDRTSFSGWLAEMLPAADPSRTWEVINAGGISYASYRVALLVEELAEYEPDLFVIYTGHNEFLEKRTYGHLAGGPGLADSFRGVMGNTRVYTLAKALHGGVGETTALPEDAVLTSEVVTRLEKSVGPEDYTRESLFTNEVINHFRFNLDRMVTLAEGAGAEVIFVTPGANLRDCSPFKSEHGTGLSPEQRTAWEAKSAEAAAAMAKEDWSGAEALLGSALEIDGDFAQTHYLRGRARYALGNYDGAATDFSRARDLDVCPLRALTALVDGVRATAEVRGVPCLDFEALVAARAENHIPGADLFLDHVHPTIAGHQLIAEGLLAQLAERLDISLPTDWRTARLPAIAERVTGSLDTEAQALALRNLAQVLSWAGKFEEARDLAGKCIALTPDDVEAHYLLAWNAQSLNDAALAEKYYRAVLAMKPDHPMASLKLAQVLDRSGHAGNALDLYRQAVEQRPADPLRRVQLADILREQGDLEEAKTHYREALRMVPGQFGCHTGLGMIALQEGDYVEARDAFARALAEAPGDYKALYGMGEVLGRKGDLDQAIDHYTRAIAADSKKAEPHLRLAWFAMRHPDPSRRDAVAALHHAREAVSLSGGVSAVALNTLAMAQAVSGDQASAKRSAEAALEYAIAEGDEAMTGAIRQLLKQLNAGH